MPGRFSAKILQDLGKPGFAGTPGLTIEGRRTRPAELDFAKELVGLGYCVVYRTDQEGNDLVINDVEWELKTLNSNSVAAVDNALRTGIPQGKGRVIIDGRKAGLTYETAVRAIAEREKYGRLDSR